MGSEMGSSGGFSVDTKPPRRCQHNIVPRKHSTKAEASTTTLELHLCPSSEPGEAQTVAVAATVPLSIRLEPSAKGWFPLYAAEVPEGLVAVELRGPGPGSLSLRGPRGFMSVKGQVAAGALDRVEVGGLTTGWPSLQYRAASAGVVRMECGVERDVNGRPPRRFAATLTAAPGDHASMVVDPATGGVALSAAESGTVRVDLRVGGEKRNLSVPVPSGEAYVRVTPRGAAQAEVEQLSALTGSVLGRGMVPLLR